MINIISFAWFDNSCQNLVLLICQAKSVLPTVETTNQLKKLKSNQGVGFQEKGENIVHNHRSLSMAVYPDICTGFSEYE